MSTIYCTYLTTYSGDKLPQYYVGSSSIEGVENGYHGSVLSKRYKETWNQELKENPHLFETKILTTHSADTAAREEELRFQKEHDVVKSNDWINQSYAAPNGYFGRDVSGENNPMYGRTHSEKTIEVMKSKGLLFGYGRKGVSGYHGPEATKKMVETRMRNGSYSQSKETREKISQSTSGDNNPRAKKIMFRGEEYGSIKSCSEATGLSRYKIRRELYGVKN